MMIVTALIAWSAASVASAMREDAMPSTYDYTTSDITSTVASVSNAATNYSDDKLEERNTPIEVSEVSEVSELMQYAGILTEFQPHMFTNLPQFQRLQKLKLINNIKNSFADLTASADIFKELHITNWMKYVRDLYVDSPEVATKAMFKLLARHFTNDHALASALVPGMNIPRKKNVVSKLLNIQVEMWVKNNKDEEAVFKLLKLDETNDNVLNSPVFSQWVNFVEKRFVDGHFYEVASYYEHTPYAQARKRLYRLAFACEGGWEVGRLLKQSYHQLPLA
ncbi:hypothetical protein KXD40_009044 [Peronospora effusa]|uniref:RxLR effector PexRD54 WY domain-containing protein n=1 Tax=Peronospora effusa TaxID=542832 RepID=A0A3R7W8G2_9STRA|nr:hypothetical protein DD237_004463 [Peronospora effusa]UIZ25198.1 hypothetical protein KXD40_009044 [Peronospora effusa]CAI5713066.1 unnamed protein product [Peronospora effusa]